MISVARHYKPYLIVSGIGLFFALFSCYVFATSIFDGAGGLLTLGFLVVMPTSLGAVSAHFTPKATSGTWRLFWNPLLTVLLFLSTTLLFHLEDMICVLMILPLFMFTATIGANLYDMWTSKRPPRNQSFALTAFVIAPFLAGTFETWYVAPTDFRRVENTILIQAPTSVVWQHITRVPTISSAELSPSLVIS
ncbi:hypothetical protein [Hymenobacter defluvii]|uniref:Uncharacterized protein n=1 Tax=Hymenobacter defluvii TaxID=2054411 RepID=A0ABS3T9B7_9BACT|nr:hypothetical protein [Hymenobacter defluvii]MBO3269918.1 hypothetical protein [Hymenobacter defluvii]